MPLKHRDNSAAALLVKLTSADIPDDVELELLLHAAFMAPKRQATLTLVIQLI